MHACTHTLLLYSNILCVYFNFHTSIYAYICWENRKIRPHADSREQCLKQIQFRVIVCFVFNLIFFLHHMLLFLLIDYPKQVQLGLVINDVLIGLSGLVEWSKRMKSKMSTSTICLRKNSKLISPSLIVRLR